MTVKKYFWILGGLFALIAVVGLSTLFAWGVYVKHWDTPFVRSVARIVPIPVARVGHTSIPMNRYFRDLDSLQTYLNSDDYKASGQQPRGLSDTDRKQAIERAIEEAVINQYAAEKKVTLSNEEIESAINQQFVGASSTRQDLETQLKKTYGWSMEDFRAHIATPILLERKLAELENPSDPQTGMTSVITVLSQRIQQPDVVRYLKF